ncbi:tRNA (adenosine(37)-N6)-threonylcarbamoyltransferase complex ATPase subunit type 1 TsaE [Candidatus Daviesbacteria bacterium]|nr:tRNA (adenosine(37)-N6)-threonylcarbamoyltransferase complex ATPase subunit type 1 TsaE [Candidatus Daviesbacteria bacterium]
MAQILTHSEQQTRQFAKKMAKKFSSGVIALTGELGAGKTIFVQGFAQGLGVKEKIISPTFVLIRQHKIPNTKKILFHVDLYRLDIDQDIKQIGLSEILSDRENIILIEWAEKIKNLLPKKTLFINIEKITKNQRKITLK